jgi:hypothetical protein
MKSWYIISLVLTVLFGATILYFMEEVASTWWYVYDEWDMGNFYGSAEQELRDITQVAGSACLLFTTFYILLFSFSLKYLKTITAKVMSILGVVLAGIHFLLCLVPAAAPGEIYFDEFGGVPLFFTLIMLAFCIVNLVQASRKRPALTNDDTLDSIL